jgi:serine/threonine protein kinase
MIGKTFAHYEITSQLGKGGMGEVFRAKDQKLGRDVGIKVLPEEFAKGQLEFRVLTESFGNKAIFKMKLWKVLGE